jgi:4-diphosphocytidyl-2-C-methyl-D-erythritol kinase
MPRTVAELASILRIRRNDLTTAALTLMPEIGLVLQHLSALPGALFAGMSGSGASCFALFSEPAAAVAAGRELTATKPEWWTAAGQLNSMPPAIEAF